MREEYDALEGAILAWLREPAGGFDELAGRLFRFQFRHNAPYRSYCESLGRDPASVVGWTEIPAVPVEAFKMGPPLSCWPPGDCERVFLTSGTTTEVRGRHYLARTTLYEASVRNGWKVADLPVGLRPFFLSRSAAAVPESSLTCMFGFLARGQPGAAWLIGEDGTIATRPLREAAEASQPVLLFATALALRALFAVLDRPLPLPEGSWVFQTGGYKGLDTAYDPQTLYGSIAEQLAVPAERVINEYGMTELCTPSYTTGLESPHRTPPWLRVRAIDPETNRPSPPGRSGHLVFVDLANLNSAVAVRTADLGIALDPHRFVLEGRDSSAEPRGCSRAADTFLQRS